MVRSGRHLPVLDERPRTRGECVGGIRPCPWVSCRYHLAHEFLAANETISDDDAADWIVRLQDSCALDVSSRGEATLQDIASAMWLPLMTVQDAINRGLRKGKQVPVELDEREHPEDPYLKYCNMGADELAEITATLRARSKR